MISPRIEIVPRRPAACSDASVTLDLLVRITPPAPEVEAARPPLNLALVLDRSGSMAAAKKIDYAREAASFAVRQLLPGDRVSVTIFDERVETIVPSRPARDKEGLLHAIAAIRPGGSTALHGGWSAGARQVLEHRRDGDLNRVLLLSDGLANVGVTDPNAIALEVKAMAGRGVSTTTLGLGDDYNEDLLEAMARAGDGNYYYVESPGVLTDLFRTELLGLMATAGRGVRLALDPAPGVVVSDILNDLERTRAGVLLPNLVVGMPIHVLARLSVGPKAEPGPICGFRLSWDAEGGFRVEKKARYDAPEVMPLEWWAAMPEDHSVVEQEALLMAARAQKEASHAIGRGDPDLARRRLGEARDWASSAPLSSATSDELRAITETEEYLARGEHSRMMKRSKYRSYLHGHSRPRPPEA